MQWIKAAEFPETLDLADIDAQLHAEGVVHRITMESGQQALWLVAPGDTDAVLARVHDWLEHPDRLVVLRAQSSAPSAARFDFNRPAPVTLVLVALCFVGAALHAFEPRLISLFTFWNTELLPVPGDTVFRDVNAGEYWRLITPVFLHFGPMHSCLLYTSDAADE